MEEISNRVLIFKLCSWALALEKSQALSDVTKLVASIKEESVIIVPALVPESMHLIIQLENSILVFEPFLSNVVVTFCCKNLVDVLCNCRVVSVDAVDFFAWSKITLNPFTVFIPDNSGV